MNCARCLVLTLLYIASQSHAEVPKLLLWPNGAPGAKGQTEKDQPWVDVWLPEKGKANGAAFVVAPGGGYGGLAADHEGVQVAKFMNSLGVTAFVLHYRLGSAGYHYPIELMDVQRAIRLVRSKAGDYSLDVNRVGIIGFSAGGHLTSMAATLFDEKPDGMTNDAVDQLSARPDVACPTYPVISMIDDHAHKGSRKNLLGPNNDNADLMKKTTTYLQVTARTPPIFIFQTDDDTVVPAENAVNFYLACRKHKVPAELHIFKPGPHGVGLMHGDPVLGTWPQHLAAWLRNQGFFSTTKRAAVSGTITINGKPASWGALVFEGTDPNAPRPTARIMGGKFKLDAANGPAIGINKLTVTYSAADVPGLDTPDGTATTSTNKGAPLTVEIKEGGTLLGLELTRE
jgi:acetyl esterase/lipase